MEGRHVRRGNTDAILRYHRTGKRLPGMAEDIDLIVIELASQAIAWTHRL
jgi:hypothetical protein